MSRKTRKKKVELEGSPQVDKWADVFRRSYNYPEGSSRREKRAWRHADRDARRAFIEHQREQRRDQEPAGGLGFAVVVALLVVVGLAVAVVRGVGGQDSPAAAQTTQATARPSASVTPGPSPSPAAVLAPVAAASADEVADAWARAWLAYTPASGDSQSARMERAQPYMTPEFAESLTDDPIARVWESEGTDVEVTAVAISPAGEPAPIDTEVRATRVADVTMTYTAGPRVGQVVTVRQVVTLIVGDDTWLVGDVISQEQ